MAQWRRIAGFLLINVLVSATTTLVVLALWDRAHRNDGSDSTSLGLALTIPALSDAGDSQPGPQTGDSGASQLQTYTIAAGETLGEVALAFGVEVEELLEINGFSDPDSIGAGTTIFVPLQSPVENSATSNLGTEQLVGIPLPTDTPAQIEIVAVIGSGDLNSERVQIRGLGEGNTLDLSGWRLIDEDQHVYTFPKITLYSSGAVNVHTKAGVDTVVALYWNAGESLWASGETATVIDQDGYIQARYTIP